MGQAARYPALTESRSVCGSANSAAIADARGNSPLRAWCWLRGRGRPSAAGRNGRRAGPHSARARRSLADRSSFNSWPCLRLNSASALGLTQIQSMPGGGRSVPLVSMAISKPSAWSAAINGFVQLQQRLAAGADDIRPARADLGAIARRPPRQRSLHPRNFPPPGPSIPTKSVSQNLQTASCAIPLEPAPQIAAGEAQEHGRAPGLCAFALQRVIDFLDRIAHRET